MHRPWALPFVPLYAAAVQGKNAVRNRGIGVDRLAWPVVSVGSLAAGGAGKTPVVRMLADLLERHRVGVDVLSRGFGRTSHAVEEVDPAGAASRFGDEPLELACTGMRVFVGARRVHAGRLAERQGPPRIHLLDDGFQHRALARQLDVVLLTAADVRDSLLPAGNLREPLRSLGRADAVLLRREESEELKPVVARWTAAEIWVIDRRVTLPATSGKPFVFCGIARPHDFLAELTRTGLEIAGFAAFRDHHSFTSADYARLVATARKAGADGFLTTAKDAVKLTPEARQALSAVGPVAVAKLQVTLADEAPAWSRLRPLALAMHNEPQAPRMRK